MIPSLILLGMVNNLRPLLAAAVVGLPVGHCFTFNLNCLFPLEKQTDQLSCLQISTLLTHTHTYDLLSSSAQDGQNRRVSHGLFMWESRQLQSYKTTPQMEEKTSRLKKHLSFEAPHDGSAKVPLLFG